MALIIAIISLIISGLTFWMTKIKKGKLKMTRPSIICLLGQNNGDNPKIFIRTLLYSTSEQGQYIENMFIRLHSPETMQNFNVWAYGDNGLIRGSGLFVNKSGLSMYHHFLLPKNVKWNFVSGDVKIEIFAETVNKRPKKIFEQNLSLTNDQINDLVKGNAIYFDWAPNSGEYSSYTETKPLE